MSSYHSTNRPLINWLTAGPRSEHQSQLILCFKTTHRITGSKDGIAHTGCNQMPPVFTKTSRTTFLASNVIQNRERRIKAPPIPGERITPALGTTTRRWVSSIHKGRCFPTQSSPRSSGSGYFQVLLTIGKVKDISVSWDLWFLTFWGTQATLSVWRKLSVDEALKDPCTVGRAQALGSEQDRGLWSRESTEVQSPQETGRVKWLI